VTTNNFTPEQDFVFKRVISPRRNTARIPRHQQTRPEEHNHHFSGIPQLIATRPGEENDFIAKRRQPKQADRSVGPDRENPTASKQTTNVPILANQPPKRFHLSKISTAALVPQGGKRKREVAVFVSETVTETAGHERTAQEGRPQKRQDTSGISTPTTQARKRPGATAATPTSGTPRKKDVSDTNPQMQYALQQYAMEEFGITYGQKVVSRVQEDTDVTMKDNDDNDDSEYIYDTYERHEVFEGYPTNGSSSKASTMMDTNPHAPGNGIQSYGILVIPEEQEELFLEIYGEDATSDDEGDWDSEQDDENAENYYAADYPEDEVASDDERGYGAYERYQTRRGEASDDDEYESEVEGAEITEDGGGGGSNVRYPWNRHQPWETRPAHIAYLAADPADEEGETGSDDSDD